MKRICAIFSITLSLTTASTSQDPAGYDALIKRLASDFKTPGVAVAVLNDSGSKEFTFGLSNVETGKPITRETLFNVASISKLVTAHAVMRLVDEGKIDLDKPIENYLKGWRFSESSFDKKLVTTRRVLNHTAGLSGEFGPGFYGSDKLLPLPDILSGKSPKRKSLRIVYQPGSKTMYSNLGFGLIQLLIEDVTGKTFEEYVNESLFTKLRMNSSSFRDPLLLKFSDALAKPYDHRMSPLGQERFVVVAAAGLISNLADLEKLLLAETKHDGLITKSLTAELHKAPPEGVYGMGHITTRYGEKIAYMGHTGLGMGWNSSFQFIPNSGSGIIVLTNGDNGFYIHNTLTCAWYYSRTKRSDKSCKVAPDKKLNLFEYVLEASYEKGLIEKTEFDKSKAELKAGRNDLNSGKFEESIERISVLRKELKAAIKDAELLGILDQAFDSYSYWIGMPWMKQTRTK